MKAVVHIGIEKTGTTALQSFLSDNRKSLQDDGFAYLESAGLPSNRKLATYCFDDDRSDDHHEVLGIIQLPERTLWKGEFETAFDNEIRSLNSSIHTVIISNEQLHSRLVRVSEIERVKTILEKYFDEIEVLVYLRRQDQLATSLYSTALKCGHSFDSILPTVTPEDHYYNFDVLLGKWAEVFGRNKVRARIFDRNELIGRDLLVDFMDSVGMESVSLDGKTLPGRQNESLDPKAQEFLRVANKFIPMIVDGRFNVLRERLTLHLESSFGGSPELPLKEDAEKFCSMFVDSNNKVAKEWFDRESLFEREFSKYPTEKEAECLEFEDAVEVSAELLNRMTKDEFDKTEMLRSSLESNPELTTRLLGDYFSRVNPKLANLIRQTITSINSAK